jgi:hypothetical protein
MYTVSLVTNFSLSFGVLQSVLDFGFQYSPTAFLPVTGYCMPNSYSDLTFTIDHSVKFITKNFSVFSSWYVYNCYHGGTANASHSLVVMFMIHVLQTFFRAVVTRRLCIV